MYMCMCMCVCVCVCVCIWSSSSSKPGCEEGLEWGKKGWVKQSEVPLWLHTLVSIAHFGLYALMLKWGLAILFRSKKTNGGGDDAQSQQLKAATAKAA